VGLRDAQAPALTAAAPIRPSAAVAATEANLRRIMIVPRLYVVARADVTTARSRWTGPVRGVRPMLSQGLPNGYLSHLPNYDRAQRKMAHQENGESVQHDS
jgi:hypothetical protein